MKLPNSENAYVPESKLSDYLLSEKHAVGKAKAKYFRSLGYTVKNVKRLQADLLVIVKSNEITQKIDTSFGMKYIVEGNIRAPNQAEACLMTVWIVEPEDSRPRLVTAYVCK